jgi:3-methyladenine DNA glycosylase AlkD
MEPTAEALIAHLQSLANPANVAGMARYGINSASALGISLPVLRHLARQTGRDHRLAEQLWASGIHEARILASLVEEPRQVSEDQMERWVSEFDSWDVCDQVCSNLFDKTPFAYRKVIEWSDRPEEFVRRAAFALLAALASHDKRAPDAQFEPYFTLIAGAATDERNYVKKAVNWALRGLGKRSRHLNLQAIATARQIQGLDSRAARWIAADALRELQSEKTLLRIAR